MKNRNLLMIPGPIEFEPAVLAAMGAPTTSHVAPNFIETFGQALERMRQVFLAPDGQPFIIAGTGTLAIAITDDAPVAAVDTASVIEDSGAAATGNVVGNDDVGADADATPVTGGMAGGGEVLQLAAIGRVGRGGDPVGDAFGGWAAGDGEAEEHRDAAGVGGGRGMAATVLQVAILAAALPGGWLTDRFGTKPLIAASGILATLGTAVVIASPAIPVMYVGGVLVGLGVGIFYTANWALGTSLVNLMIAVGISQLPRYARVVRASALTVRGQEFVEAARAVGARDVRIIVENILPNCMAPIIVQSTLGVAQAILSAAALSLLGLGIQPPTPEWGSMLSAGRQFLRQAPYLSFFPGLAISIVVLALNIFGDGLRDSLDPKLRQ